MAFWLQEVANRIGFAHSISRTLRPGRNLMELTGAIRDSRDIQTTRMLKEDQIGNTGRVSRTPKVLIGNDLVLGLSKKPTFKRTEAMILQFSRGLDPSQRAESGFHSPSRSGASQRSSAESALDQSQSLNFDLDNMLDHYASPKRETQRRDQEDIDFDLYLYTDTLLMSSEDEQLSGPQGQDTPRLASDMQVGPPRRRGGERRLYSHRVDEPPARK